MKQSIKLRRLLLLMLLVSIAALYGCAGMEFAPKRAMWYYHKELPEADRAVEAARTAGKDKQCPEEFKAAEKMRDDAYNVYWACHTAEGIDKAKKATDMAKALCPTPPPPPPTPAPTPTPEARAVPTPAPTPTPKKVECDKEIAVIKIVNFDFDKYSIKMAYKKELHMAAEIIKKYPKAVINVDGHTCSIGTDKYNMGLSTRRANAVKEFLIKHGGVDASKIAIHGYGESRPAFPNTTKDGRKKNRRAEIHIMQKQECN
ncbi:MAG: OmpA family protein [Candidatus Magnetobacterium sp. LHC-1]|uniref:OmpA family protein n=1 Tax=Candidatus Magnetobacterium casense TaxID=1455061 RepID=A0ABS6RY04_9BACT|nr:OmpA family protein [Candidatus Magnetobacterium casensis]MBF0605959.1 OmpA family protein [Nitrospirota bacterium]MBV6340914.1 OmpA family protein [Candidatus Magnetobacterium casensis]